MSLFSTFFLFCGKYAALGLYLGQLDMYFYSYLLQKYVMPYVLLEEIYIF